MRLCCRKILKDKEEEEVRGGSKRWKFLLSVMDFQVGPRKLGWALDFPIGLFSALIHTIIAIGNYSNQTSQVPQN